MKPFFVVYRGFPQGSHAVVVVVEVVVVDVEAARGEAPNNDLRSLCRRPSEAPGGRNSNLLSSSLVFYLEIRASYAPSH